MKQILIIIPSYNEEANIAGVLRGLHSYESEVDILVINDGSWDKTTEIVRGFPVLLVSHPCNLGYGAALQTGYRFAVEHGYQYVIQFDADGQHDPSYIRDMIAALTSNNADIVLGSRYMTSSVYLNGLVKGFAVHFFRRLIYLFTRIKVSDPTTGFRGLRRNVFQFYAGIGRFPADFPDADMLIHMIYRHYGIREIPVRMRERKAGVSMHGGIKPIFYMMKMMLSITLVLIRNWRMDRKEMERRTET